jgi:hypothetical protein
MLEYLSHMALVIAVSYGYMGLKTTAMASGKKSTKSTAVETSKQVKPSDRLQAISTGPLQLITIDFLKLK